MDREPLNHSMRQSKTSTTGWLMGGTQDMEALYVQGFLGDGWHCKVHIVKIAVHLESNGKGKLLRGPGGRWGPALSHSSLVMTERDWDDKDLGARTEGLGTNRIQGLRVSCRSQWPPGCWLGWQTRWQYQGRSRVKLTCRPATGEKIMRSGFDKWGGMPGRQFYIHRSPDVEKRAKLVI